MQPKEDNLLAVREPLSPPAIDPRLEELNPVVRSTECLRHFVLSVEFWISPSGRLRQWIKLNVCLASFLLIPAVLVMPVISLVLNEVDGWLSLLLSIVWKLIVLGFLVIVVACVIKHRHEHFSLSEGSSNARHRKRGKPPFGGIAL